MALFTYLKTKHYKANISIKNKNKVKQLARSGTCLLLIRGFAFFVYFKSYISECSKLLSDCYNMCMCSVVGSTKLFSLLLQSLKQMMRTFRFVLFILGISVLNVLALITFIFFQLRK